MATPIKKPVTTVGDSAGDSTLGLEASSFGFRIFRVFLIYWVFISFSFNYLFIFYLFFIINYIIISMVEFKILQKNIFKNP